MIFLQEMGRGLRKDDGKEYLTVLDFIGNYKRAHYIPLLLAGENPMKNARSLRVKDVEYPELCQVQFDFNVLDLFESMTKNDPLKERMKADYFKIKSQLGRRPWRLDIYEGSDIPIREYLRRMAFFSKQCG